LKPGGISLYKLSNAEFQSQEKPFYGRRGREGGGGEVGVKERGGMWVKRRAEKRRGIFPLSRIICRLYFTACIYMGKRFIQCEKMNRREKHELIQICAKNINNKVCWLF
jgi:hypothetical protein